MSYIFFFKYSGNKMNKVSIIAISNLYSVPMYNNFEFNLIKLPVSVPINST